MHYTFRVNGRVRSVDVDSDTPLLWVLRDAIDLKGTKFGCGVGLDSAAPALSISTASPFAHARRKFPMLVMAP